jgi:hypothetical protein
MIRASHTLVKPELKPCGEISVAEPIGSPNTSSGSDVEDAVWLAEWSSVKLIRPG